MISFMIFLALTPLWVLVLHALAGRVLRFFSPQIQPQVTALLSIAFGYLPAGLAVWSLYLYMLVGRPLELMLASIYAFVVYSSLSYSYFHLFNMSETARRIRMLSILSKGGPLSPEMLGQRYGGAEMLGCRLERLLATGQIRLDDGRYVVSGKPLLLSALAVRWWARVLGLPFGRDQA